MTSAPRAASSPATVLLPVPMPPESPITGAAIAAVASPSDAASRVGLAPGDAAGYKPGARRLASPSIEPIYRAHDRQPSHGIGHGRVKLATRRRRIALPGGGGVSAVVALPSGSRPGRTPAIIPAHGAGGDMKSPFVSTVHAGLAREGYIAVKFNFPYAEARRRSPDPRPVLERCYRAVLDAVAQDRTLAPPWIAIGGKSL